MNEILNCRFLTTAQTMSDEDIAPSELQRQLDEFISLAKGLLCGNAYFDVTDTLDSLLMALDKVLSRKKKVSLQTQSGTPATKSFFIRRITRSV